MTFAKTFFSFVIFFTTFNVAYAGKPKNISLKCKDRIVQKYLEKLKSDSELSKKWDSLHEKLFESPEVAKDMAEYGQYEKLGCDSVKAVAIKSESTYRSNSTQYLIVHQIEVKQCPGCVISSDSIKALVTEDGGNGGLDGDLPITRYFTFERFLEAGL